MLPRIVNAWKDVGSGEIFLFEDDAQETCQEYVDGYVIQIEEDILLHKFFDDYFDADREMCEQYGGVAIGPDYIAIYDQGEELVYWQEDEWLQEPELAINLANAIHLYYTRGPEFIREKLRK